MDIKDELLEILSKEEIDYITFTSSSTVKYLVEILGDDKDLIRDIKKVSIGSITSQTIRDLGFDLDIEADQASIDSMILAILEDVNK
jgi:uroporphyrinogen-III C-methyltransferase